MVLAGVTIKAWGLIIKSMLLDEGGAAGMMLDEGGGAGMVLDEGGGAGTP